jgi:quercetin dioxygenase-like cupin family protein
MRATAHQVSSIVYLREKSDMKLRTAFCVATLAGMASLVNPTAGNAAEPVLKGQTTTQAFQYAIANVPGKTLTAVIVDYAPGAKSPSHRHGAAFVTAYVLSGAIRSQVNNGKKHVFRAGESWTEMPGDHHTISENASSTEPAKLLAVFVADTSQHDFVTWDKK